MGSWTLLIWVAVFGVIIYFFMIRPNKKRSDEQKSMMDSLQPGTRVMLTSGIFGTIETMGDQQAVIELAPGTAITVVKQAIAKVLTEADEEFEYSDDDDEIEGSTPPPALTTGDDADDSPTPEVAPEPVGDEDTNSEPADAGDGDEAQATEATTAVKSKK